MLVPIIVKLSIFKVALVIKVVGTSVMPGALHIIPIVSFVWPVIPPVFALLHSNVNSFGIARCI